MLFGLLVICNISISMFIGLTLRDVFAAFTVYFCITILAFLFDSKF